MTDAFSDQFRRAVRPGISFARDELRPDEIFHYTAAAAFERIIATKALRATNVRFLDDPTEVTYGLGLVSDELANERKRRQPGWRQFCDDVRGVVEESALAEFYMACFSGMEDDLGQWRAYATGPTRYALGFESEKLYDIAKAAGGRFIGVIYDEDRQRDKIKQLIDRARAAVSGRSLSPRQQRTATAMLARYIVNLITRFKSAKYKAEHEWRVIVERPAGSSRGIEFDASRGYLRPYVTIKLAPPPLRMPLSSVWILAPGRYELAAKATALAMRAARLPHLTPNEARVPIAL